MDKVIGMGVLILGLIALIAFIGGTVVWFTWPVAIPAAFPGLVASGAVPAALGWWESVCLTWLTGTLIKSVNHNTSK